MILTSLTLGACNPLSPTTASGGKSKLTASGANLTYGYGYVLKDDPIALSGNKNLDPDSNLSSFMYKPGVLITVGQYLQKNCSLTDGFFSSSITTCIQVLNDRNSTLISPKNGKWPYTWGTKEFLDVHTYYHVSLATDNFHSSLAYSINNSRTISSSSSLPNTLSSAPGSNFISDNAYWEKDPVTGLNKTLQVFSNCAEAGTNAYFDPAKFELCFGYDQQYPNFKFAYDPSVIYHELGHSFVNNMMNVRNRMYPLSTLKTNFGNNGYTEAGAINEGISDYFAYVINGRTLFSEWALGSLGAARTMSEDEPLEAPGLDVTPESRLAYPAYLNYNAALPEYQYKTCGQQDSGVICFESIHNSGQIASHYLVALTKELKTTCGYDHATATKHITYILAETFAELGDITKNGKNNTASYGTFSNLVQGSASGANQLLAHEWAQVVNPPNFRRFFQTFARNLVKIMTNTFTSCPFYTKSQAEVLLDSYGLLLFKSYNDNGNDLTLGQGTAVTVNQVATANRVKSVLIPKSLIGFTTTAGESKGFVFDSASDIQAILSSLSFGGNPVQLSSMTQSDLRYNNNNGAVSPGEVVGLALNLQNSSNSTMAGIQVLANDWDHAEAYSVGNTKRKACQLSDGFPLETEGGSVATECSNPDYNNAAPICYVQLRGDSETRWISQEEYKQINGDFPCLFDTDRKNCMIRVIPQASEAHYSVIEPGKTWGKTITSGVTGATAKFGGGNVVLFEVNKWIPPGTTFNCRFRVRFSNCSDCYHDPALSAIDNDDYKDNEYAGEKPFKLLNLQFTVTN
ncbi:MAG: hypothetical protein ACOYL6_15640 [Bacteriovoracaceae bacterium]